MRINIKMKNNKHTIWKKKQKNKKRDIFLYATIGSFLAVGILTIIAIQIIRG